MSELQKNQGEFEKVTATEEWVRSLNPEGMAEILAMSSQEVENYFAALATVHLESWDKDNNRLQPNTNLDEFSKEEIALMQIETVKASSVDVSVNTALLEIKPDEATGPGKLENWGDLTQYIEGIVSFEEKKPINILVSGLPISGKATTRRALASYFSRNFPNSVVASIDRDYSKMYPDTNIKGDINIVEDVHGLDPDHPNSELMDDYVAVVYTTPNEHNREKMIRNRGNAWAENISGKADLTDGEGNVEDPPFLRFIETWRGMSRAQDGKNVLDIDMDNIEKLRAQNTPVMIIDTSELIKSIYKTESQE